MENTTPSLDTLLNEHFQGKVVRKDLTKLLKEGANVPVYVLEYLLGIYCASDDEDVIQDGIKSVKDILSQNYVRLDEAEKVKSIIRERGSFKIIDKVTVTLNERRDCYEAFLSNLGVRGVEITTNIVKEQLKKLGGMEFYDVYFSYIDKETREEKFVSVPEQGGSSLIPDGPPNPGTLHTVGVGDNGHLGLYRIETQVTAGNGKLSISGVGAGSKAREPIKVAFDYFKAHSSRISAASKPGEKDFHLHIVDMHNNGPNLSMTLPCLLALCSGLMARPVMGSLVVVGDMSLGGSIIPADNLAACLQVAFDSGAKRVLIPMSSVGDIPTIPGELFAKFQTSFYADPVDAVFKGLGVE